MKAIFTTRLEVSFPSKPTSQIIGELKRRGFWWDSRNLVWWLAKPVGLRFVRNEPIHTDGMAYALDYLAQLGLTQAERDEIKRRENEYGHTMGARGMEDALGING